MVGLEAQTESYFVRNWTMHFSHTNIVEKEWFLALTNNTLVGFGHGISL